VATKFKLSVVLPIAQLIITAILTYWADRVDWIVFGESNRIPGPFHRIHIFVVYLRLVWRGVNAPALPFSFAGYAGRSYQILGFGLGELLYFAAVAIVWRIVGRYIERQRGVRVPERQGRRARMLTILGMAWGILLLGIAIISIHESLRLFRDASLFANLLFLLHFRLYLPLTQFLFLLWSFAVIAINGATLAHDIRRQGVTSVSRSGFSKQV
jgi:hypothetical protein